jgi:N-acylneuraminate cytidylyltransferase
MNLIALIPARSGSKRIPNKNIKPFFGHPLIAYAVDQAIKAEIFDGIYVSSDSDEICRIAEYYGAKAIARPSELALDSSPDSEWITHALFYHPCDVFMILRPTAPFRTLETIKRAWEEWDKEHCMKAIQPVSEHPGKMWRIANEEKTLMFSAVPEEDFDQFEHLLPIQNLRPFYIQNASLEIRTQSFTNFLYQPFFTRDYEGFDLNSLDDWILAEALVERGLAKVPKIERKPWAEK